MRSATAKVDAASSRVAKNKKRLEAASTLFRAFDPSEPIAHLSGNLPHWRQEGTTYFVTFRTADSLPQEKMKQWLAERKTWLLQNPNRTPSWESVIIGSVFLRVCNIV